MNSPSRTSFSYDGTIAAEGPGVQLARDMRRRWRAGERSPAEDFLSRRPELWQEPQGAMDVIYEEYCLRQSYGEQGVEEDLLRRFPQWAGPLRVMLDCHLRVLEADREQPRFPTPGDRVGEFKLLAELARGARGRVFLAEQTALADRPVVLKVTPLDGAEHQSLARLQHTHIAPLYCVMDDPGRGIRVLCMPYFGRATLASLLQSLSHIPPAARMGRHVLHAIDQAQEASSPAPTGGGAARQMLANVSYVQAVTWITACLADALQFAHERGLVHLDLKPSNILLAGDGQPMLLDFHLAREPVHPGEALPENFGGTPPYMPPEQRAAMHCLREGRPVQAAVDARADIFALGAMLYESLGGSLPISPDSPRLARLNPQVSTGLSDIVARCLAARSQDRYTDAASLADDLRRHLTDQPLIGVRNRSLAERWHKWRRRRPNALRGAALLGVILGAAIALIGGGWSHVHHRHQQAEMALYDGQRQLHGSQRAEAVRTFARGLDMLDGLPFEQSLRRKLRDQLDLAQRLRLAEQLHQVAEEARLLYGNDAIGPSQRALMASRCAAIWLRRATIIGSSGAENDSNVAVDLQDIAILAANLRGSASGPASDAARGEALQLLDEATAAFGDSAVLRQERRLLGGGSDPATPTPAPRTAWEHCVLGRSFLSANNLAHAHRELSAALRLDPGGRWPNFYYGLCAYRMGGHEEAVAAFSVCIGTAPNLAGCFYNRGLSHAALGRSDDALRDYDRALQIEPTHAAAALNRAMLHFSHKRFDQAKLDLGVALQNGADAATVHYDLALVHLAAGDPTKALDHARQALEHNAGHEQARRLLDSLARP